MSQAYPQQQNYDVQSLLNQIQQLTSENEQLLSLLEDQEEQINQLKTDNDELQTQQPHQQHPHHPNQEPNNDENQHQQPHVNFNIQENEEYIELKSQYSELYHNYEELFKHFNIAQKDTTELINTLQLQLITSAQQSQQLEADLTATKSNLTKVEADNTTIWTQKDELLKKEQQLIHKYTSICTQKDQLLEEEQNHIKLLLQKLNSVENKMFIVMNDYIKVNNNTNGSNNNDDKQPEQQQDEHNELDKVLSLLSTIHQLIQQQQQQPHQSPQQSHQSPQQPPQTPTTPISQLNQTEFTTLLRHQFDHLVTQLSQQYQQQIDKNTTLKHTYSNLLERYQNVQIQLEQKDNILTSLDQCLLSYNTAQDKFNPQQQEGVDNAKDVKLISVNDVSVTKLISILQQKMITFVNEKQDQVQSELRQKEQELEQNYNNRILRLEQHFKQQQEIFLQNLESKRLDLQYKQQLIAVREDNVEYEINKMRNEYILDCKHKLEAIVHQNQHLKSKLALIETKLQKYNGDNIGDLMNIAQFYYQCVEDLKRENFISTSSIQIPTPNTYIQSLQLSKSQPQDDFKDDGMGKIDEKLKILGEKYEKDSNKLKSNQQLEIQQFNQEYPSVELPPPPQHSALQTNIQSDQQTQQNQHNGPNHQQSHVNDLGEPLAIKVLNWFGWGPAHLTSTQHATQSTTQPLTQQSTQQHPQAQSSQIQSPTTQPQHYHQQLEHVRQQQQLEQDQIRHQQSQLQQQPNQQPQSQVQPTNRQRQHQEQQQPQLQQSTTPSNHDQQPPTTLFDLKSPISPDITPKNDNKDQKGKNEDLQKSSQISSTQISTDTTTTNTSQRKSHHHSEPVQPQQQQQKPNLQHSRQNQSNQQLDQDNTIQQDQRSKSTTQLPDHNQPKPRSQSSTPTVNHNQQSTHQINNRQPILEQQHIGEGHMIDLTDQQPNFLNDDNMELELPNFLSLDVDELL
jgi:hypothetical protein